MLYICNRVLNWQKDLYLTYYQSSAVVNSGKFDQHITQTAKCGCAKGSGCCPSALGCNFCLSLLFRRCFLQNILLKYKLRICMLTSRGFKELKLSSILLILSCCLAPDLKGCLLCSVVLYGAGTSSQQHLDQSISQTCPPQQMWRCLLGTIFSLCDITRSPKDIWEFFVSRCIFIFSL